MALILGHSQAKYFGDLISDKGTTSLYFSGAKVEDLLSHSIVQDCVANVKIVAVLCGINNVYHRSNLPASVLLDRFEELFDGIRQINPTATVILSSILPVATNLFYTGTHHDTTVVAQINNVTKQTNDGLLAAATQTPGLHFIEHH